VKATRVQRDEIWAFCYAKKKNVETAKAAPADAGDIWTWTALDADSKLIVSYLVGSRDTECANAFMLDTASRMASRVQLTTDNLKTYLDAVEDAFGGDIDYAILVKLYGDTVAGAGRYSPAECTGIKKERVMGNPERQHISTSNVERLNLSMRMSMRRFTRLTNAFSKKVEAHMRAVALYFTYYNFIRQHKTLRVSPAMAAGISDRLWSIEDIVALIDSHEIAPKRPWMYKTKV
jgi:IS1 family transposase